MNTLFISTYCDLITISLLRDGHIISLKEEVSNRSHSIYTVPLMDEILKENCMDAQDLNEILVINGPGSFTGIRLGVTVAKTLAYTLNIPIKTISSIEALAVSTNENEKIVVVSDSKGKYFGVFKNNNLISDLMYLKDDDYDLFSNKEEYNNFKTLSDIKLNVEKIYEYSKKIEVTPAHAVKAIYIKGIEALNGK